MFRWSKRQDPYHVTSKRLARNRLRCKNISLRVGEGWGRYHKKNIKKIIIIIKIIIKNKFDEMTFSPTLDVDSWLHLSSFLDLRSTYFLCISSKANYMIYPDLKRRVESVKSNPEYHSLVRALSSYFKDMKQGYKSLSLGMWFETQIYRLFYSSFLSIRHIIALEKLLFLDPASRSLQCVKDVLSFPLYVTDGNVFFTLCEFMDVVCHRDNPIHVFFRGYAHILFVYSNYFPFRRPTLREGEMYSWGFAERIAGLGRFDEAPKLCDHIDQLGEEFI